MEQRQIAITRALRIYDAARRPRTQPLVNSTVEAGNLLMGMRQTFEETAEEYARRNREVWSFDLDSTIKSAVQELEVELQKSMVV